MDVKPYQDDPRTLDDHVATLRRYSRALTAQTVQADMLVEECLARALKHVPSRRGIRDLRLFLFAIMHEVYAEFANRSDVGGGAGRASDQGTVAAGGQLADIHRALQRLPDEQRETLLLLSLDGITYHDVADVMDVPVATVLSRLSQARETLRHRMNCSLELSETDERREFSLRNSTDATSEITNGHRQMYDGDFSDY